MNPIIIIGSGHAGLTLARELRARDKRQSITIVSQEPIEAYYKPNLSKALTLNKSAKDLVMKNRATLEQDLSAELLENTSVAEINCDQKRIQCIAKVNDSNEVKAFELAYDKLVIATGATPISLPIKDAKEFTLTINNLQDYKVFREQIKQAKRIVIIGAGFVGSELASDLSNNGYQVDVVDRSSWPLQQVMPQIMGSQVEQAITEQGATWHFETTVEEITKNKQGTLAVYLANGKIIETDRVISAVGLKPNIDLAQTAGLKTSNGIVIDSYSQTSADDVFAIGDCVEYNGKPLPFIAPATLAAKTLAKTLSGDKTLLKIPPQPVAVKINKCPTLICPANGETGDWKVSGENQDIEAEYVNERNETLGFALSGKKTSLKADYLSRL